MDHPSSQHRIVYAIYERTSSAPDYLQDGKAFYLAADGTRLPGVQLDSGGAALLRTRMGELLKDAAQQRCNELPGGMSIEVHTDGSWPSVDQCHQALIAHMKDGDQNDSNSAPQP